MKEGIKINYTYDILNKFSSGKKKYKILVDCANGVTNNFTPFSLHTSHILRAS